MVDSFEESVDMLHLRRNKYSVPLSAFLFVDDAI